MLEKGTQIGYISETKVDSGKSGKRKISVFELHIGAINKVNIKKDEVVYGVKGFSGFHKESAFATSEEMEDFCARGLLLTNTLFLINFGLRDYIEKKIDEWNVSGRYDIDEVL